MSVNYDFGTVKEYSELTTSYEDTGIDLGNVCNQIAIINETNGRVDIRRDGVMIDALAAGRSRSYVNWGIFRQIELKYSGTQPTSGFVAVQGAYTDYFG